MHVLTTNLCPSSTSAHNYDKNSDDASCSSFLSKPNASSTHNSTTNPTYHPSFPILEQVEEEVDYDETDIDDVHLLYDKR